MFVFLVSSFVIACSFLGIAASVYVLHQERQGRLGEEEEIILAAEPLRPEWIYGPRMDVPGRYPLLRTRSTKQLR